MRTFYLAAALAAIGSAASAQSIDSTNTSEAYSQSGIWNEGDDVRTYGSTAAPGSNSTADCAMYQGGSVLGLGGGFARVGHECNTKREASILRDLAALRLSADPVEREQARASIIYLGVNDASMRDTFLRLGWMQPR